MFSLSRNAKKTSKEGYVENFQRFCEIYVFNFIVLCSYRAIHVFYVLKFSYHVATHEHESSIIIN